MVLNAYLESVARDINQPLTNDPGRDLNPCAISYLTTIRSPSTEYSSPQLHERFVALREAEYLIRYRKYHS